MSPLSRSCYNNICNILHQNNNFYNAVYSSNIAKLWCNLITNISHNINNTLLHTTVTQHRYQHTSAYKKQSLAERYDLPYDISKQGPIVYEQTIQTSSDATTAAELAHKLRRYKPLTPGMRHRISIDRSELYDGPVGLLVYGKRRTGGRNSTGRVTNRNIGGGHKQLHRVIDFKRDKLEQPAIVQRLEYDPTRTAYIALIQYNDNTLHYILAPHDMRVGDKIIASRTREVDIKVGNAAILEYIPTGTTLHCIELVAGKGAQLARSAGTYCILIGKNVRPGYALVELSSKEQRLISMKCLATIGSVSNPLHKVTSLGKAGRSRWLGRRPHVRGVAMNPVDHPMGGGFNAKGRHPVSPTGVLAKGFKTRNKKKHTSKFILVPRGGIKRQGEQ